LGDSASKQAVTRVNAEQASKRVTRKPTRLFNGEGRRCWERAGPRAYRGERRRPSDSAGVVATACMHKEMTRNTGSPTRWGRVTLNGTPARDRFGRIGWRRGP
jgi:hypothetical protein